jgi:hypothetical protein
LTSCKENKKTDLDLSSRPEIIDILHSEFNGKSIILSKSDIFQSFGKPTFEKLNCVTITDLSANNKDFKYDCLIYSDSITKFSFDTYNKIGYLSYLSFDSKSVKIKTPKIDLTNKTSIQEIKEKFPKAYKLKIINNKNGHEIISLNDNLMDSNKEFANIIELEFNNGILKYYKYQMEPEYITQLK